MTGAAFVTENKQLNAIDELVKLGVRVGRVS
jgi:hypothetical protein